MFVAFGEGLYSVLQLPRVAVRNGVAGFGKSGNAGEDLRESISRAGDDTR